MLLYGMVRDLVEKKAFPGLPRFLSSEIILITNINMYLLLHWVSRFQGTTSLIQKQPQNMFLMLVFLSAAHTLRTHWTWKWNPSEKITFLQFFAFIFFYFLAQLSLPFITSVKSWFFAASKFIYGGLLSHVPELQL